MEKAAERSGDGANAVPQSHFVSASSLRERLDWLNRLRWGAVAGVVAGAVVAGPWLRLDLPLDGVLSVAAGLAVLNALYVLRNRRRASADIRVELRLVKVQMVGDLLILTTLLNLTGGLENPFFFIYIIHVILASLLFRGREIYQIATLAIVLFSGMVLGEYLDLLPHRHVVGAGELGHGLPFVLAGLGAFWLVMLTCAYLGASIMKHNRAIKDELVAQQAALVRADEEKMQFFRFVTHEVKSPVNTAQSAVAAALELDDAGLSEPVRGLLRRALARLEQATVIVRDLADLTRGGGLTAVEIRRLDLGEVVAAVLVRYEDLAAEHGSPLVLRPCAEPTPILADSDMLDKVVANLVGNAIRYGTGGQVTVTVTRTATEATLAVADRGIGIPREDREKIFTEFYRTQRARELSQMGTGLGLSIVRRFVDRMGGRISVESQVGVGSVFSIVWPLAREEAT